MGRRSGSRAVVNASPGTSDTSARRSPRAADQSPKAAASTTDDAPDAQPQAVTTWDGFQAFVTTPVAAPPPPGAPPRSLEERLAYHSRFVTVRTPAIDALAKNVRTLMILGRHQAVTARPSLIVTGPAGAGKPPPCSRSDAPATSPTPVATAPRQQPIRPRWPTSWSRPPPAPRPSPSSSPATSASPSPPACPRPRSPTPSATPTPPRASSW